MSKGWMRGAMHDRLEKPEGQQESLGCGVEEADEEKPGEG